MAINPSPSALPSTERQVREASKVRRDAERKALRATILKAAGEVFLEKGYEAFSMRQVAVKIGYSATTIYHHFVNKEDLLMALLNEAFVEFSGAMRKAIDAEPDPAAKMGAMGKAYVRFGMAHPTHYQLMYLRKPGWITEKATSASDAHRRGYEMLFQGVEEGIEKGWLPRTDPQRLADWMWATVHGLVMLGLTEFAEKPERLEAAMTLFDLPSATPDEPGRCP